MKWSIIIVLIVGLIAALASAILIGALLVTPADSKSGQLSANTQVVLANIPLSAMSVVTSGDIVEKSVPKENLPEGYLTNPAQAIGRVLSVSIVEGQILTKSCFVTEGSLPQLAAAIPRGMRAISIMLSNQAITGGLLYPGCVVDILASFRMPSRSRSRGQAISTTLLQGIQVLAVENISVVSSEKDKKKYMDNSSSGSGRKLVVTLMVNPRQAEALQLAKEYGSVSVAMRNPLDRYPRDDEDKTIPTVLSEGQLAKFGSALTPTVLTTQQKKALLEEIKQPKKRDINDDFVREQIPQWEVTIIRGQDIQMHQLDINSKQY